MVNHLLFERFVGIAVGTVIAESLAGIDLCSDPVAMLREKIWQELANQGHGLLLSGAIASWDWSLLHALDLVRATLPLAVFFHDEPEHWVETLGEALGLVPEDRSILRLWARIVADILMEREGHPHRYPHLQTTQDDPVDLLDRALRGQWSSCEQAPLLVPNTSVLDPITAIALALFYSGDTPHHFRLAVLRSMRGVGVPEVTSLIGSLMGGRLGMKGIPWAWRCRKEISPMFGATLSEHHSLVESLWMQWLGSPSSKFSLPLVGAIATASTIQPRSHLSLVSQSSPPPILPNRDDRQRDRVKGDKIIFLDSHC